MFGEMFQIYCSQMAYKTPLDSPPWLEKIFKFTALKCLKTPLNFPPWLEKIFKFTALKLLRNFPPCLEKIFKFTRHKWLKMHLKFRKFSNLHL